MPNWTNNRVSIRGLKADLDKFLNDGEKGGKNENGFFSFESWIPMPKTYVDYDTCNYAYGERLEVGKKFKRYQANGGDICTEKDIEDYKRESKYQQETYGVVGWYDWRVKYWGCKWDTDLEIDYQNEERIDFVFDTPWSAPREFFDEISRRYPTLEIWLYSHYEDNYNEANYYYEGNRTDISDEIMGQISSVAKKGFADKLDEKGKKLFNEWIDEDCYDMSYLSKFVADDNDEWEEIEIAFNDWLEWAEKDYKVGDED